MKKTKQLLIFGLLATSGVVYAQPVWYHSMVQRSHIFHQWVKNQLERIMLHGRQLLPAQIIKKKVAHNLHQRNQQKPMSFHQAQHRNIPQEKIVHTNQQKPVAQKKSNSKQQPWQLKNIQLIIENPTQRTFTLSTSLNSCSRKDKKLADITPGRHSIILSGSENHTLALRGLGVRLATLDLGKSYDGTFFVDFREHKIVDPPDSYSFGQQYPLFIYVNEKEMTGKEETVHALLRLKDNFVHSDLEIQCGYPVKRYVRNSTTSQGMPA